MLNKVEPFRRANFFTGLLAGADYWNEIQDYHFRKENLYNKLFNGYGLVPEIMEEMHINPVKKGGLLTIIIGSGMIIDGLGRSAILYEPVAKTIDYKKFKLPTTVYITVSYHEVMDEYYNSNENIEHQGYKKKIETARIDITSDIPDNITSMEIARIYLEEDENGMISDINEAEDISEPQANEIDTRFIVWAKTVKSSLSPYLKANLIDVLDRTKNIASMIGESVTLTGLRELQSVSMTGKMLAQCGDVDFKDVVHIIQPIYELNSNLIQEMLEHERVNDKRVFSAKESFQDYRLNVYALGELIKYNDSKIETVDKIIKCQEKVNNSLRNIIAARKVTYEDIMLFSDPFPRILVFDDKRYTLVDYLDFNDPNTVKRNAFESIDTKDIACSRHTFQYPDEKEVSDSVYRYVDGEVCFTLNNLIRRRELLMIRRTDIFHGNYSVDVLIDDQFLQELTIDGSDTRYRWRNLFMVVPDKYIKENSAKITFSLKKNGRDNFGMIMFYQLL